MYNNDYLEKVLGDQYNMKNYFADTYQMNNQNVEIIGDMPKTNNTTNNTVINREQNVANATNNVVTDRNNPVQPKPEAREHIENANIGTMHIDNSVDENQNIKQNISGNAEFNINQGNQRNVESNAIQSISNNQENENMKKPKEMYLEIYNAIEPIVDYVIKKHMNE